MEIFSRFFKSKDKAGAFTYEANFTLGKVAIDEWLYRMTDDIKSKVFKRLEDKLYEELKDKIVADDVLTTKFLNELRINVTKRMADEKSY